MFNCDSPVLLCYCAKNSTNACMCSSFFVGKMEEALTLYKEMADKKDLSKDSAAHFLTSLNYSSNFSQIEYLNYCKKINEQFKPTDLQNLIQYETDKNPQKLNIGFISPDFIRVPPFSFTLGTDIPL